MQIRKSSVVGWALGLVLVVTLASCVGDRLVGTWEVAAFEMQRPGQQGVRVQNIGTITFDSDQTGEKEIQYSVLDQNFTDTLSFTWSKSEGFITLEGGGSEFAKTWIVVDDERTTQRWRSTDGMNTVQMLELRKR
ncbi:lipocalin family protein [Telluribacter sp. SYSU D00476]|uniref:lipocalin family protein n=1 Tax=Telluribacter sp. SYSU D00476 TaxID=2811430 RepID=UPI001FF5F603|nr:lipocalin family protein [Telluribacter sp. SYSU D00476]